MTSGSEAPLPFGINTAQVQIFLDDLAGLDFDRAVEIWNGYAVARPRGYGDALYRAQMVAAKQRTGAWLHAREVAGGIARERLGDSNVTANVEGILANAAGSLVIRDLLSRHDFRLLQLPWTRREDWTGRPVVPDEPIATESAAPESITVAAPAAVGLPALEEALAASAAKPAALAVTPAADMAPAPVAAPVAVAAPTVVEPRNTLRPGLPARNRRYLPRPLRFALIAATVAAMAFVTRPSGEDTGNDVAALPSSVLPSQVASGSRSPSEPPTSTGSAQPAPTERGPSPSPIQRSAPPPPPPTPQPTAPPRPTPTPTPRPTPTPEPTAPPQCTVVNLVGISSTRARQTWAEAGFTGTVTFSPAVPPKYVIAWQSRTVGQVVSCTLGITVSDHAP